MEPRRPRGRVAKASDPKPIPQPVTDAPTQPQVAATKQAAKPEKAETKTTTAPKAAGGKPKKKPATTSPKPVVANPHPTTSPIEGISDLLDNLPLDACVELTRRLLTSILSLPKGAARPRAVLKTVIFIMTEYGSTP